MRYVVESTRLGESLPVAQFVDFDSAYGFAINEHKEGHDVKLFEEHDTNVIVELHHTRV